MADLSNRDVILKAAAHIEKHGLAKKEFYDSEKNPKRVCIMGSLLTILLKDRLLADSYHEYDALMKGQLGEVCRKLCKEIGIPFDPGALLRWNDDENRTAEEVVAVMRKAAAK